MVVGNTSKYVEGFESFTADDEIMLANLKQAVNYTKANMAISDVSKQLSTINKPIMSIPETTKAPPPEPPSNRQINTPLPTNSNSVMRTNPTLSSTSNNSSIKKNNSAMTSNSKKNMTEDMTDDIDMSDDMADDMDNDMANDMADDMADDMAEEDMDKNMYNESMNKNKNMNNQSMNKNMDEEDMDDETMDDEDIEEGFRGSQNIEHQTLRKMLLALLITFLGYMLILGFTNNLIPITTYAPELKQFKHLIYGGFFFLIVYICLEIF
jgi:hypothetical protein